MDELNLLGLVLLLLRAVGRFNDAAISFALSTASWIPFAAERGERGVAVEVFRSGLGGVASGTGGGTISANLFLLILLLLLGGGVSSIVGSAGGVA